MKKVETYMNILNDIQTHKYREKESLHKMMWSHGMLSDSTRYAMIKRLINSTILVKIWKTYQVVEHKQYKKI